MDDKTYYELLVERDHARHIWLKACEYSDTNRESVARAIDHLCKCQQRLEKRERHELEG